ncbi:cytochrome P450 [Byssothecium circinans]|uniref:Cytochrome P450 n=1 Tax=Byssothecium circinans TaxID=147558 RepID=A0A6A5TV97_9PLEO|nr:cytochrome P450 [Byssothecium circinans]
MCYFALSKPLAAALGLLSHAVLNQGEWDGMAHLLLFSPVPFSTLVAAEYLLDSRATSLVAALKLASATTAVYLATLVASILIYRGFFHRLRKFPSPFLLRFSKFSALPLVAKSDEHWYEVIRDLHRTYRTDIIRTGPCELSIASPDAIKLIHGPLSKCRKSTSRNKQEHRERRKLWDRGFNTKALKEYESRLNRHALGLMEKLGEQAELGGKEGVRISSWNSFYSFDVMGDIGFSRSFGMVEKGREDDLIAASHRSFAHLGYLTHFPWLTMVLTRTKTGAKDLTDFLSWTRKVLIERHKTSPPERDVMSWLLENDKEEIPLGRNADTRLLIVAGSDTTATTLTFIMYELCNNPDVQKRLRETIDKVAPEKSFLEVEDVANIPYLQGVINEGLRMWPAVPSGVQRETPASGIVLPDQTYIPGNNLIWTPIYTLLRDERSFPSPSTFMPTRWTDEAPEYVQDKRAFIPFSTGRYDCIGQKLSLMEMRSVPANFIRRFEISHLEGGDRGESFVKNSTDCFVINMGNFDVKLTKRGRS